MFYGLTLKHGKGHCARAIMESIAFMLRKILADFQSSGIPLAEVRSMGGGARSDLWLQIKADVIGVPLVRMEEEETSTLGAAMLAAVRVGDYTDIAAAAASMVRWARASSRTRGPRGLREIVQSLQRAVRRSGPRVHALLRARGMKERQARTWHSRQATCLSAPSTTSRKTSR